MSSIVNKTSNDVSKRHFYRWNKFTVFMVLASTSNAGLHQHTRACKKQPKPQHHPGKPTWRLLYRLERYSLPYPRQHCQVFQKVVHGDGQQRATVQTGSQDGQSCNSLHFKVFFYRFEEKSTFSKV